MFATDDYSLPLGLLGQGASESEIRHAARSFLDRHGDHGTVLAMRIARNACRARMAAGDVWERIAAACLDIAEADMALPAAAGRVH